MAEKLASIEHLASIDTPGAKRRRRKRILNKSQAKVVRFLAALAIALIFLAPIVFTMANSFMSAAEISSNYGAVFQKTDTGGKVYIGKTVTLKLIPDIVSFSQYITLSWILRQPGVTSVLVGASSTTQLQTNLSTLLG